MLLQICSSAAKVLRLSATATWQTGENDPMTYYLHEA